MEIVIVIELSLNTAAFPYLQLSSCLGEDTRCKDHKLNLSASNSSSVRSSRLVLPAPSSSAPCLLHDLGVWTKWRCKSLAVLIASGMSVSSQCRWRCQYLSAGHGTETVVLPRLYGVSWRRLVLTQTDCVTVTVIRVVSSSELPDFQSELF